MCPTLVPNLGALCKCPMQVPYASVLSRWHTLLQGAFEVARLEMDTGHPSLGVQVAKQSTDPHPSHL
jgi:hypothetical protein